jgi:hypothetical protein
LLLTACSQPQANDEPDNQQVDEHRDQWRPREAQSDFLDIGKQAGIEWLSFVPDDQHDYPEYFEGLDRDQKRRLRLAPKGSDEQVLIQFDLPKGSKLWPVDWYGTELMAVERPADRREHCETRVSVAIAADQSENIDEIGLKIAKRRASQIGSARKLQADTSTLATWRDGWNEGGKSFGGVVGLPSIAVGYEGDLESAMDRFEIFYSYCLRRVETRTAKFLLVLEYRATPDQPGDGTVSSSVGAEILRDISIKRELALEGSPKHKCTSSLAEQLRGTLRFPDGTLKLSISEGLLVRKIGGDSTIQIDGKGAEPWILIRRLKETKAEGDLRARLRSDTTFNRRLKVPSGKFSEGYVPEGATLPIVCFDYDDSGSENNVLGVLKAGDELLTFEVVSRGVKDGDFRRLLKRDAIRLLAGASAGPAAKAPEFEPLIGWNVGTMGQGK